MRYEKRVIVKYGGSLLVPEEPSVDNLSGLIDFISDYVNSEKVQFFISIGGGKTAAKYIDALKSFDNYDFDMGAKIGVAVTKFNAEYVRMAFGDLAHGKVYYSPENVPSDVSEPVVICASNVPGTSSNYDAVMFAKVLGADRLINLSNIDYVYTEDPRKNNKAEKIETISWESFMRIIPSKEQWDNRLSVPFDPFAAELASKIGLLVYFVKGNDFDSVKSVLLGGEFKGTTIGV